jgi:hypothetical protein
MWAEGTGKPVADVTVNQGHSRRPTQTVMLLHTMVCYSRVRGGTQGHTARSAALARVPLDPEKIRGCAKPFEPQVQHACHGSRKQGKFVKSGSSAPSPRNASVVSLVAYRTLVTITNYGNPLVICGRGKV